MTPSAHEALRQHFRRAIDQVPEPRWWRTWWRYGVAERRLGLILRRRGKPLVQSWHSGDFDAALASFAELIARHRPDVVEFVCTAPFRMVAAAEIALRYPNSTRGLVALRLQGAQGEHLVSPTELIATNRTHPQAIRHHATRLSGGTDRLRIEAASARVVIMTVRDGRPGEAAALYRCAPLSSPTTVSIEQVDRMIALLGDWLFRAVDADGRMTYKYWPARGVESERENTVRRFLATQALAQVGQWLGRDDYRAAAEHSLGWNLRRYYVEYDSLGAIEWEGKTKLGAAAAAIMAILDIRRPSPYLPVLRKLLRGMVALWQENGAFRTFLKPAERNDNQNFYPGEALLALVRVLAAARPAVAEAAVEPLLARLPRSFDYYREWHRSQPNPAFIPWHTQAWTYYHFATGDPSVVGFIFEINDWLLRLQQWDTAPCPDLRGRFHDPRHPEYGPPHASSTGVYLEGLAEACRLARACGDRVRADSYRQAIRRGLRSIHQLQFIDWRETYYLSHPQRVIGAVRTEAYNNEIRVDNEQHALLALLKIRRYQLL